MLRLKDIFSVLPVYNESDFYVKIKLIFGNESYPRDPLCYWSTMGQLRTFMEIGLRKINGAIYDLTIISLPPMLSTQDASHIISSRNVLRKEGLPFFDTTIWNNSSNSFDASLYYSESYQEGYYIREKKDFEVYVSFQDVTLLFSPNNAVLHVANKNIIFGFDEDNFLCFIRIEGMVLNNEGFLEKRRTFKIEDVK